MIAGTIARTDADRCFAGAQRLRPGGFPDPNRQEGTGLDRSPRGESPRAAFGHHLGLLVLPRSR